MSDMERDEEHEPYYWDFETETVPLGEDVLVWRVLTDDERRNRYEAYQAYWQQRLERWNASVRRADGEG